MRASDVPVHLAVGKMQQKCVGLSYTVPSALEHVWLLSTMQLLGGGAQSAPKSAGSSWGCIVKPVPPPPPMLWFCCVFLRLAICANSLYCLCDPCTLQASFVCMFCVSLKEGYAKVTLGTCWNIPSCCIHHIQTQKDTFMHMDKRFWQCSTWEAREGRKHPHSLEQQVWIEKKGMTSMVSWTVLADFWSICTHNLLILSSRARTGVRRWKSNKYQCERKPERGSH